MGKKKRNETERWWELLERVLRPKNEREGCVTRGDQALSFHEKWTREDTEYTLSNFTPPVCVRRFSLLLWQFLAAATLGKEG